MLKLKPAIYIFYLFLITISARECQSINPRYTPSTSNNSSTTQSSIAHSPTNHPKPLLFVFLHGTGLNARLFDPYTGDGSFEDSKIIEELQELERECSQKSDQHLADIDNLRAFLSRESNLRKKLENSYAGKYTIHCIALNARAGIVRTTKHSIDKQTHKSMQEIHEQISILGLPKTSPIFLIGHSQGGLVACNLGRLTPTEGEEPLNIQGVITIGAPLHGVPLLRQTPKGVIKFMHNGKKGLKVLHYPVWKTGARMMTSALCLGIVPLLPGLRDMCPKSSWLENLKNYLCHTQINHLFIGGNHTNLYNCGLELTHPPTEWEKKDILKLNKAYTQLVTKHKQKGGEPSNTNLSCDAHDMLIPLESQLAHHLSYNPYIQRVRIDGVIHAANIMPMSNTYMTRWSWEEHHNAPLQELESPEIVNEIVAFCQKILH